MPVASSLGEVILLLDLAYVDGSTERYQLPLAYAAGSELESLRQSAPGSLIVEVQTPTGTGAFHDAVVLEVFRQALLTIVKQGGALAMDDSATASDHIAATLIAAHESRPVHEIAGDETSPIAKQIEAKHTIEVAQVAPSFVGHMPGAVDATPVATATRNAKIGLRGEPSSAFAMGRGEGDLPARIGSAEQSNTNILYGQRVIMKLFRRLQPGLNPDIEIGRFLTDVVNFPRIAPFLGEIALVEQSGARTSLAMVQGLVANEGDGWEWTQSKLAAYFAQAATAIDAVEAKTLAADYLSAAALLGKRTAEMHLALATPTTDSAFAAEPYTAQDAEADATRITGQMGAAFDALAAGLPRLTGEVLAAAEQALAVRGHLSQHALAAADLRPTGERIRIHGDYHLGQILRTEGDFVLLDFEGEPAKSLEQRRSKQSPLRDVAGMLRSFSYAAASALNAGAPDQRTRLAPWASAWEKAVCDAFLESYMATARNSATLLPEPALAQSLLQGYLLEKALYELLYELNNRPAWVGIPLAGILNIATTPA